MERGIRRALAKAGTGKDHPLGDYKGLSDKKIPYFYIELKFYLVNY